jgi:hypothetical protein
MLIDKSLKPNYYLITLLTIDPDDITKSKMLELDPETIEAGVFMDKECKIPAPISDPRYHLKPGEHEILAANPEEGGYIKLNADGYIPFEYFDKHVLALWFEFENTAEMLANNDYDAVKHHGHLVMVRDYSDDPRIEHPLGRMWAIYRLEGNNPRDINSWHMIFYEAWFREYIHWEDIPKDIQSTVQQIDDMVAHSHHHFSADTLDKFGVDADGNLWTTYNPKSKWDWWSFGGRWSGELITKSGEYLDECLVKEIDTTLNKVDYKNALRFWDVYVDKKPLESGETEDQFSTFYKESYFKDRYLDRETYAKCQATFCTRAVVTPDGEWHEAGEMGWFGCSSETGEEWRDWVDHYKERFIDPYLDMTITMIDCHI